MLNYRMGIAFFIGNWSVKTDRTSDETSFFGHALTDRHREILELASRHRSQKQIARALGISPNTVKTHATEIRRRFKVENMREALAIYQEYKRTTDLIPKVLPTSAGIDASDHQDSNSKHEAREHPDNPILNDQMDRSGEQTDTVVQSRKERHRQNVGIENSAIELQDTTANSLSGHLLDFLVNSGSDSAGWIRRLTFPGLLLAIFMASVGIILVTTLAVTCLIGLLHVVQSFSGQTG
ncbi:response regulator transcription factor [Asticcacaulis sp. W401b]|uniref:response regulator transcription factor n=1 Tax=Asticcacaulis sp. W401b TaxID=3388666 RepID=UPI0039706D89